MPKKLKVSDLEKIANDRGGKLISILPKIKGKKRKCKWECAEGHRWDAEISNVKSKNQWCKKCYFINSRTSDLEVRERIEKILKKKPGKYLDHFRKNNRVFVKIDCHCCGKKPFEMRLSHLENGHWHKTGDEINLSLLKKIAKKKGGDCLKIYKKKSKHGHPVARWKCIEEHEWDAEIINVKNANKWCALCSSGFSERVCRIVFETIFNTGFPKAHPDFLLNKQTGRNLELDGYSEKLKIAFEYQGFFHYAESRKINKKINVNKTKSRDKIKKELCKKNGIKLIVIPEINHNPEKLIELICKSLKKRRIRFNKNNLSKIDINKAYFQTGIGDLRNLLSENNFKLKNNLWKGAGYHYEIICPKKHESKRTIHFLNVKLKPDKWCTTCNNTRKFSNRYNEEKITNILNKYQIKIINKNFRYSKATEQLSLKCYKGHHFKKTFKSIKEQIRNQKKIICSVCMRA